MVTAIGRSLRRRRSRSADSMVFSPGTSGPWANGMLLLSCPGRPSEVGQIGLLLPVGLHQHAVDIVDIDGLGGTADGLDQAADAEVSGLTQHAVGTADDEIDGGPAEGVVPQAD